MSTRLGIIGYGLLGRLMAWRASLRGYQVSVYEQNQNAQDSQQACFAAGGMLAPFSELEQSEPQIFHLGCASLEIWPQWIAELDSAIDYHRQGSLIVAHPRDRQLWLDFRQKTCRLAKAGQFQECLAQDIEAELHPSLDKGLFFPFEQHLAPDSLLPALAKENEKQGIRVHYGQSVQTKEDFTSLSERYDYLLDCRGIGARNSLTDLRGVRGEALLVHAKLVHIKRPIRLLHPRYALYIVPRRDQYYYLGATQVESENLAPITVRSSLELLSAAFAVHTGFADAHVVHSFVGLRPALSHHNPKIFVHQRRLAINGLYRHGYLLSPVLVEHTLNYLEKPQSENIFPELFVHQEFHV
ncbi:MAG: FAD-dependent oxidoreductase [Oligoflexus sp.]